jgi:hypothetical protein
VAGLTLNPMNPFETPSKDQAVYGFWIPVDNENHARGLCSEHGLTFRHVRRIPQLRQPVKVAGAVRGQVVRNARHLQAELYHCRALKRCTKAEASDLMAKFGVHGLQPEEIAVPVGAPIK